MKTLFQVEATPIDPTTLSNSLESHKKQPDTVLVSHSLLLLLRANRHHSVGCRREAGKSNILNMRMCIFWGPAGRFWLRELGQIYWLFWVSVPHFWNEIVIGVMQLVVWTTTYTVESYYICIKLDKSNYIDSTKRVPIKISQDETFTALNQILALNSVTFFIQLTLQCKSTINSFNTYVLITLLGPGMLQWTKEQTHWS